MLIFKVILVLGLLGGSALASPTVRCSSPQTGWCLVTDRLDSLAHDEKLIIENIGERNNITTFKWAGWSKYIPKGILETFPNLESLDLGTGIESIDESDFTNGRPLMELVLVRNEIKRIPSNVFHNVPNLKRIIIISNKISEIEDFAFKDLNKLEEIELEYNLLTSLKKNTFTGARKLRTIDLTGNDITSIEDGTFDLPKIEEIYLNYNHLQTIPDRLFANAPALKMIDLSENEFKHLPSALTFVPKLDTLYFHWNPTENMQLSEFARFKKLDYLSVQHTGVLLPTDEEKSSKSILTQLDLDNNGLGNPDLLKQLTIFKNIKEIYLKSNKFTRLNGLANVKDLFPNLQKIDLANNEIDCDWLREILPKMKKLDIELSTGAEDESREVVDGQACGKIPK